MSSASLPHTTWALGERIGTSDWMIIEQARVDGFAALTDDAEPLHNDPTWCKENSPFGTTIAHGFLTLSLLTRFMSEVTDQALVGTVDRKGFPLNYGFDKIRFVEPVLVGSRIRCHITLLDRQLRGDADLLRFQVEVEIEDVARPALTAEWLTLWVRDGQLSKRRARDAT